jgi:carboxylate-amine ligase
MKFKSSPEPTVGIEIELSLVDRDSMALVSRAGEILARTRRDFSTSVKPELMQCYLEINSKVSKTVSEAGEDLRGKLEAVERVCDDLGIALYWTGTHPFSLWEDQIPTPTKRYLHLLETLQDMGRQLVTFGLHVHVGVDSGDKAVMICDRILRHLPLLLAASCNSPWWNHRISGLRSHRSKIMAGLPTAGLPPLMRNWSEYVWLVTHLEQTGFIDSIRDIWWTVRPHHNFGTVEVRVCDMPGTLDDVLALAALIHSLVDGLSAQIDEGTYQHDCHPMLVRQNMWRAERFGLEAQFVDAFTHETLPARETLTELVDLLAGQAEARGCTREMQRVREMASQPTWADRQLALIEETGDLRVVVAKMIELSRVSAP